MTSLTTTNVLSPPRAFLCSSTNRLMNDPILSLCGHLFNRSVFIQGSIKCSLDGEEHTIAKCFAQPELANAIAVWKKKNSEKKETLAERLSRLTMEDGSRFHETEKKSSPKKGSYLTKKVTKAHLDDIHGFINTTQGFVSGSKDGTLKMWSSKGQLQLTLGEKSDYRYWITALESFPDGSWGCGCRDGGIYFFSNRGKFLNEIFYQTGRGSVGKSKQRNMSRINCITHNPFTQSNKTLFFSGTPKFWQVWNLEERRLVKYYKAHSNDWVYCIDPLNNKTALVVIGSSLERWTDGYTFDSIDQDITREPLIKEKAPTDTWQRPHISSICRTQENDNGLAAALFDGSLQILDIEKQSQTREYREHEGRVWKVINIANHLMGSGADDGFLKIWDLRQEKSVMSLGNHPGRVSSLLKLDDYRLISGSCADNPHASREKAVINFWDLRKSP